MSDQDPKRVAGVDVSHWHPVTNWGILAQHASFIGIKATEGETYVDPMLGVHRGGFRASSLALGIYFHFARRGDAVVQAKHFAAAVGELGPHERLCLDLERDIVSLDWVNAFYGELMGSACGGTRPLIYTSARIWQTLGDPAWDLAADIDLWVPRYSSEEPALPSPWAAWKIWQWSESATVAGISGPCDANWFAGDAAELQEYAGV